VSSRPSRSRSEAGQIATSWSTIGDTLPQAVAIAISPIPIVLVILVLVSERGRITGPAFVLGWIAGVFGTTLLAAAISQGANVGADADATDAGGLLQILLGSLFVFLAVRQWRGRPRPGQEQPSPKLFDVVEGLSAPKALGLGVVAATANPKNLPLTISAGVSIALAGAVNRELVAASIVFAIVASAVVLALVAMVLVLGDRTRAPLDALKTWLVANNATIMMVLFAVLGAVMLGSGLRAGS
jgi:threonine/homoserine/homoserine lactone efflux protein